MAGCDKGDSDEKQFHTCNGWWEQISLLDCSVVSFTTLDDNNDVRRGKTLSGKTKRERDSLVG